MVGRCGQSNRIEQHLEEARIRPSPLGHTSKDHVLDQVSPSIAIPPNSWISILNSSVAWPLVPCYVEKPLNTQVCFIFCVVLIYLFIYLMVSVCVSVFMLTGHATTHAAQKTTLGHPFCFVFLASCWVCSGLCTSCLTDPPRWFSVQPRWWTVKSNHHTLMRTLPLQEPVSWFLADIPEWHIAVWVWGREQMSK